MTMLLLVLPPQPLMMMMMMIALSTNESEAGSVCWVDCGSRWLRQQDCGKSRA